MRIFPRKSPGHVHCPGDLGQESLGEFSRILKHTRDSHLKVFFPFFFHSSASFLFSSHLHHSHFSFARTELRRCRACRRPFSPFAAAHEFGVGHEQADEAGAIQRLYASPPQHRQCPRRRLLFRATLLAALLLIFLFLLHYPPFLLSTAFHPNTLSTHRALLSSVSYLGDAWERNVRLSAAPHKLYTHVDRVGLTDPTWNEKFVFSVDDAFLRSDPSAVDVHLHATHGRLFPFRDHLLGIVSVVLSTLRPVPGVRSFVALQVRRPVSLCPQGVLNLSVALLDPFARNMPLYCGIWSTSVYKDLMGEGKGGHRRSASEGCEGGRLERKRSVEEEKESEELETKLEIWNADMLPDKDEGRNRIKKRNGIRRLSFFS